VTAPVVAPPPAGLSISITPTSGAGNTAKFVMKATDSAGYASVQQLNLFIGTNIGGANQCYLDYEASSRTLYLLSSDASHWMPATVGSGATLMNSVCTIRASQVLVTVSGTTLTVSIPVMFSATMSFKGTQNVLTFGADAAGKISPWQQAGTWAVQ